MKIFIPFIAALAVVAGFGNVTASAQQPIRGIPSKVVPPSYVFDELVTGFMADERGETIRELLDRLEASHNFTYQMAEGHDPSILDGRKMKWAAPWPTMTLKNVISKLLDARNIKDESDRIGGAAKFVGNNVIIYSRLLPQEPAPNPTAVAPYEAHTPTGEDAKDELIRDLSERIKRLEQNDRTQQAIPSPERGDPYRAGLYATRALPPPIIERPIVDTDERPLVYEAPRPKAYDTAIYDIDPATGRFGYIGTRIGDHSGAYAAGYSRSGRGIPYAGGRYPGGRYGRAYRGGSYAYGYGGYAGYGYAGYGYTGYGAYYPYANSRYYRSKQVGPAYTPNCKENTLNRACYGELEIVGPRGPGGSKLLRGIHVWIDGVNMGSADKFNGHVSVGTHNLRLVSADGGTYETKIGVQSLYVTHGKPTSLRVDKDLLKKGSVRVEHQ